MRLVAPSEQYQVQQGIAGTTAAAMARVWRGMGDDFDESWSAVRPQAVTVLEAGRRAAVANAVPYTGAVLAETGQVHAAVGVLAPAAFLAASPDGRDIGSLLDEAVVKAKVAVAGGARAARDQLHQRFRGGDQRGAQRARQALWRCQSHRPV